MCLWIEFGKFSITNSIPDEKFEVYLKDGVHLFVGNGIKIMIEFLTTPSLATASISTSLAPSMNLVITTGCSCDTCDEINKHFFSSQYELGDHHWMFL